MSKKIRPVGKNRARKPKTKPPARSTFFFAAVIIALLTVAGAVFWQRQVQRRVFARRTGADIVYLLGEVLGVASDTAAVEADFGTKIVTGSPLIFGGAHTPKIEHEDAWVKICNQGVTILRQDLFPEYLGPRNITLDDYRSNRNNINDPASWNLKEISNRRAVFDRARQCGMKIMGIMTYAPNWLTYTGSYYGVPKDWSVYEDIVGKTYTLFRNHIDYLEIWNEPNLPYFLNTAGSGLSPNTAYTQIFIHAARAIRNIDAASDDRKRIPLGGPASYTPNDTTILEAMLKSDEVRRDLDFISLHSYEPVTEPSWIKYQSVLKNYGKTNLPIYITEWAASSNMKKANELDMTVKAIPYTGKKLLGFLNYGIAGANYSMMQAVVANSPRGDEGFLGFYYWKNNQAELLPKARTWRLLSRTLGLGDGASTVYRTVATNGLPVAAFTNFRQAIGLAIANEAPVPKTVTVTAANTGITGERIAVSAYIASAIYDGSSVIGTKIVPQSAGTASFQVVIPARSIVGLTLTRPDAVREILSKILP
jgi:hypothetical protein